MLIKRITLSKFGIKLDGVVAGIWKWVPIGVSHARTSQQLGSGGAGRLYRLIPQNQRARGNSDDCSGFQQLLSAKGDPCMLCLGYSLVQGTLCRGSCW